MGDKTSDIQQRCILHIQLNISDANQTYKKSRGILLSYSLVMRHCSMRENTGSWTITIAPSTLTDRSFFVWRRIFAIVAAVAATNVLASPAEDPAAALGKRQSGVSCAVGGDTLCNTVCKQEGKANGGHCNAEGTCVCNPSAQKRQHISCPVGGDAACGVTCEQEGKPYGGHCEPDGTCVCNPPPSAKKRQSGVSCAVGGDTLCNTVCKQEGKANGGHCNAEGTCVCNPTPQKRQSGVSCAVGGDTLCNTVCKQEGDAKGGHCDASGTCVCN